ncbi:hypothetical protein [Nocardia sp. NPDC059239]|uniref:hypothetical protein n=1 Tax=Nocardia sp. NPDC059239 TaxID=3346785 RepID=UPI0036B347B9
MPTPDDAAPQVPDTALESLSEIGDRVTALLTRAARMRRPTHPRAAVGTSDPASVSTATVPVDFAGFLVPILASVAANRGGIAALHGRPDSWEAERLHAALESLLASAGCCEEPEQLARFRTEPIMLEVPIETILLDAAEAVPDPDRPGHTRWQPLLAPGQGYDDQLNELELARGDAIVALENRHVDEDYSLWSAEADKLEADFEARCTDLHRRWQARYTRYLDAFAAHARAHAVERFLDQVPIEVRGETDPERSWDASRAVSDIGETDPLATQLYEHAVLHTPVTLLLTDVPESEAP